MPRRLLHIERERKREGGGCMCEIESALFVEGVHNMRIRQVLRDYLEHLAENLYAR